MLRVVVQQQIRRLATVMFCSHLQDSFYAVVVRLQFTVPRLHLRLQPVGTLIGMTLSARIMDTEHSIKLRPRDGYGVVRTGKFKLPADAAVLQKRHVARSATARR